MKKTLRFAALMLIGLLPLIMWSCSDDDDNGGSRYASLLVGTWVDEDYPDYGITFKSDGTIIWFGSGTETGTYTVNSDEIRVRVYDDYYDEYETESFFIIAINESRLVLMDEDSDTATYIRVK